MGLRSMPKRDFSLIVILLLLAFVAVYVHQSNTIDRLRSENQCLIRTAHIGSAAVTVIGKDGHSRTVYGWEDCTK